MHSFLDLSTLLETEFTTPKLQRENATSPSVLLLLLPFCLIRNTAHISLRMETTREELSSPGAGPSRQQVAPKRAKTGCITCRVRKKASLLYYQIRDLC